VLILVARFWFLLLDPFPEPFRVLFFRRTSPLLLDHTPTPHVPWPKSVISLPRVGVSLFLWSISDELDFYDVGGELSWSLVNWPVFASEVLPHGSIVCGKTVYFRGQQWTCLCTHHTSSPLIGRSSRRGRTWQRVTVQAQGRLLLITSRVPCAFFYLLNVTVFLF